MINGTMIEKQDEQEVKGATTLADNLIKQFQSGISDNKQNGIAGAFIKDIRSKYKILDDKRLELTRPITAAKKVVDDFFNVPLAKLKAADKLISDAMKGFWQVQEDAKRAEEARLQAIANKEAAKLAARAEKAEASGKDDKADELRQKAMDVQANVQVVESKVDKVAGVSMRTYYYAEAINETLLLKTHPEFFSLDQVKLNKYADAMKGAVKIEGIKFWSEAKPVRTR